MDRNQFLKIYGIAITNLEIWPVLLLGVEHGYVPADYNQDFDGGAMIVSRIATHLLYNLLTREESEITLQAKEDTLEIIDMPGNLPPDVAVSENEVWAFYFGLKEYVAQELHIRFFNICFVELVATRVPALMGRADAVREKFEAISNDRFNRRFFTPLEQARLRTE